MRSLVEIARRMEDIRREKMTSELERKFLSTNYLNQTCRKCYIKKIP